MLIMRIQRAFELSDVVEIQVFFQDKLATTYTLSLSEPLFNTLAEHLCFNRAGLRLPVRDTVGGRLVPRRWKLELRLEGSVDKQLLDKIQLADPEIKVLSPEPDPQVVEQSIRVGTEASEPVPLSIVEEPKMGEDRKADTANPIAASDESPVDIKILRESKVGDMKRTDTSDKSHQDDDTSEEKSQSRKTTSLKQLFKPAVPRVAIKVAKDALANAKAHAATSHNEVGGVLVGRHIPPESEDGIYTVEIDDTIPGKHLVSRGASVTFTADTWSTAIQEVEKKHGDARYIVGWYHTHPGFGIFMSGYDRFIHENYFNEPWQVALVIDPHADNEGFFAWHMNDKKEQILEKYPKGIEFLEGTRHPPVEQVPKDLTEPKEPTREEPKEETAAPVPMASEKPESKDTSRVPGHESTIVNAQVAGSQALPSGDTSGQVVEGRSSQESGVHLEPVIQQAEKPPDEKSDQVSAPVSEDSTTPSAKVRANAVSHRRMGKRIASVMTFVSSVGTKTISLLRRRR